jgi:hypothetical protein
MGKPDDYFDELGLMGVVLYFQARERILAPFDYSRYVPKFRWLCTWIMALENRLRSNLSRILMASGTVTFKICSPVILDWLRRIISRVMMGKVVKPDTQSRHSASRPG